MIRGKVVAITGATSGIGRATALHLVSRGAKVVLGARDTQKLRDLSMQINSGLEDAIYVPTDVSKRGDVEGLVKLACQRFGKLDVLFSNAGAMPIGPLDDVEVDDWERMVDVNLKGVLFGVAAALPIFRAQGSGHFIHTASTAARKVVANQAVYAATKAAVVAFSEGLRQEIAGKLRVTLITPGFTATNVADHVKHPAVRQQLEQSRDDLAMSPEAIAAAVAFAIDQPDKINIGEIVLRSTSQT